MKKRILLPLVFGLLLILSAVTLAQRSESNLLKDLRLIQRIIQEVYEKYVDPIDTHKLIMSGVKGLLSGLDHHTVFMTAKETDDLRTSTQGEFGGLGIIIGMRDDILTVISPMEGTPAYRLGLKAGDKIVAIDGDPTKGMNTEDAVEVLRGEPGTDVTITIVRIGEPEPIDYTITRAIIHIDAVPFAGMTEDSIGYIRLARFSDDAGPEVRDAIDSLKSIGMKGLIFDLRSNPGGLLSQAVEVASVFLEPGDTIVYTKGRDNSQRRDYIVRWGSSYTDGPLVVLVNGGSASASEIVSGAIQDHDRGVVMGTRTFGKGLVQSVIPLQEGEALKITTAHYYISSGRNIQKEDYLDRPESVVLRPDKDEDDKRPEKDVTPDARWWEDADEILEDDGTEIPDDAPIFYTKNGRVVYGGGGVMPDLIEESDRLSRLAIELERKSTFFDFAVLYVADNPDTPPDFTVDEDLYNEFLGYLNEKEFSYRSVPEIELARVESTVVDLEYGDEVQTQISELKEAFEMEKKRDYERNREYIERSLKREIVLNLWGENANYQYVILKTDDVILKAADLILNTQEYIASLEPPKE
ncbi:MAG: S41 family peptidase [bacterium]